MSFLVEELSPGLPFGKVVRGLKAKDIEDPATRARLVALWNDAGMLVFKDGDITERFHVELSRVFGPLEIHPTREFRDKNNPELLTIAATGEQNEVELDGKVGDFQPWHKDLVHNTRINRGGILRSLTPSYRGGLTGFTDGVDAYNRLSDDLKRRIAGLHVVYQMNFPDKQPYGTRGKVRCIKMAPKVEALFKRRDRDYPPNAHPLVFDHPETGRKVLNFSPGHSLYVEELPQAESHALLQTLAGHIFDGPAYHHQWSTDEMVLWDNWRMLHMVSLIPLDEDRVMQRTTISGDYGFGREIPPADFAARTGAQAPN